MIDDRLRSAAMDLRVEAERQVPPPLRAERHRLATVAAYGLVVAACSVGVMLYSIRQGQPSPVVDEPVPSAVDTGRPSTPTVSTTSPSAPTTAALSGSGEIEHVSELELSEFIGTYEIDYRDANLSLGQVGSSELTVEVTTHSFCLRFIAIGTSSCRNSADGSTLPTRPERMSTSFASSDANSVAPLISLDIVAPDGVVVRILDGDQPVCDLQRFALAQLGTAVVWACQARGPTDRWDLAATKDGRTLAAPAFSTLPDPSGSVP